MMIHRETLSHDNTNTGAMGSGSSGSPSDAKPPSSPSLAPLFALIIGIDNYPNCQRLRGAVADANAMKDYMEEVLRVPQDHIRTLLDGEASRDAIIDGFRYLRDDVRIQFGDPIVIFYAGHGSELHPPRVWGVDGKIQCLLPHNYKPTSTDHSSKKSSHTDPIPDRTIGALIEDIAKIKGDNVTVIFDCCHSSSGTRDENQDYVPRTVILDHTIPDELDSDIWGDRAGKIPDHLTLHGLRSHVLLAACGEKEFAYEHGGHGQFTTALLSTLKGSVVSDLTYLEVIRRIRLPRQNPHCEGHRSDRILFDAKVSPGRQARYSVRTQGFKHIISAGLADGVSHGVELTLYTTDKQRQYAVMVDHNAVVEDFQTTVTIPVYHPDDSFAKLTRVGKVPFYLSSSLKEALWGVTGDITHTTNFHLAENAEAAKLEVTKMGQEAVLKILDKRLNDLGLTNLPRPVPLDRVVHILDAATYYYWFLDLANKSSRIGKRPIDVDFYSLMHDYDDYGNEIYIPNEPSLCLRNPNLDGLDVIEFVVDPEAIYGIKITNNTSYDLYLNAFLFNNGSFSIEPYRTQTSVGNPDPPLKKKGVFTIGYGSGGMPPFMYSLEQGQDVDVSYLKIFLATRPIDLSNLEQKSPFTSMEKRDMADESARKARVCADPFTQGSSKPVDLWFTVEIPVVQRRG